MANFYWYGGTGNWSDYTNHWSANSGNSPSSPKANAPTSADNCYFDVNSFTGASQIVTVDATANCKDMDWTGVTNTPQLAGGPTLFGDVTMSANMTMNSSGGTLNVCGADSHLTTNGLNVQFDIVVWAGGKLTLSDNLITNNRISLYVRQTGILDTNGKTFTGKSVKIDQTGATTLTLGSSTLNLSDGWYYTGSNLTLTANTATINITGTGAFTGGGATTYYNVNLNGTAHTISGSNTFSNLTFKADTTQTITFTDGTTQTVTTPVITGSSGKVKTLQGSSTAGWNIIKSGGGLVSLNYMSISYSKATPAFWQAGANSTNGGNNSGWLWGGPGIVGVQSITGIQSITF